MSSPALPSALRTLWIGTYPDEAQAGSGEGVWRVGVDLDGPRFAGADLAVPTPSPSFLALHPSGHTLYAIAEVDKGTITAFAVEGDHLTPRGPAVPTGGESPCHVLATGEHAWVANYGDGVATAVPLAADGAMGQPRSSAHRGQGPDAERQGGPHAHFVAEAGGAVLVVDLGTDDIRRYAHDAAGSPADIVATLPPGTGPRHLAVLAGGALAVVGELDPAVFVLAPDDGRDSYGVAARYEACATPAPDGVRNYPSHVVVSEDGTRLFVAVRGADVLSAFAVDRPDDARPRLRHLADTPVGGRWPRHVALLRPVDGDPADLLVVANQNSSTLTLLRVPRDGGVGEVVDTLPLPVPACVVEG